MREVVIEAGFGAQGKPDFLRVAAKDITLELRFTEWEILADMPAATLPQGDKVQAVRQEDLLRMFAAGYERLLEEMGQ